MGKKKKKIRRSYLVKWLGYNDEHSSWEPEANLNAACLQEYWDWQGKQTQGSGKARTGVVVTPEHDGAGIQQAAENVSVDGTETGKSHEGAGCR